MRKFLLLRILAIWVGTMYFSSFAHASQAWPTYQTMFETGTDDFAKPNGINTMTLTQTELWNPFAASSIVTCSGNGCWADYMVDSQWFDASHPLWAYADASWVPQQSWARKRDWTSSSMYFDDVNPTCSAARVYTKDASGNLTLYTPYSGWTNKDLWAQSYCFDTTSGCVSSESPLKQVSSSTTSLLVDFTDNAGNTVRDCKSEIKWKNPKPSITGITPLIPGGLLLDVSPPGVDLIELKNAFWDTVLSQNGVDGPDVSTRAGAIDGKLIIFDEKTPNYGVSWVKSVQFSFRKTADYLGNPVVESPVSCLNKQDFPDYNPAGDIVARDTQTVTFSCSNASGIQKTGTYLLTLAISDQAGNVTTVDKKLTVYPASVSNLKSEVRFTTDEAVLADGTTPRNLKLTFRDEYENRIYNKAVRIDDTNGKWGLFLDMVAKSWPSSIVFKKSWVTGDATWDLTTDTLGEATVGVASNAPGTVDVSKFEYVCKTWDNEYVDTSTVTLTPLYSVKKFATFNKLYKWAFSVTNGDPVKISISQNFKIQTTYNPASTITIASYLISDIKETLKAKDITNWSVTKFDNLLHTDSNPTFDATTELVSANAMTSKDIEVTPKINYTIGGKAVKYVLSSDFEGTAITALALNGGSGIDSLKIIGLIQGATWTSQNIIGFENISGINGQDAKSQIKKSITIATRWMNGAIGQISEGIKYVSGTDFEISAFPTDYETLVINNANVIIKGDIVVPAWKKFAIVAFKDDQTDLSKGNIYIGKDVGYIEALLVADGGLVSTGWSSWSDRLPNYVTDSNRSNALTKQLVIHGSAITNNTIWGAIKGTNTKYGLPLGETTDNISLATALDLNYLRTSNLLRDATKNLWNTENTLIIYNPDIVKNPPKGFVIQ